MDARVTGVSGGWSRDRGEASLSDVNRSVVVRSSGPTWRRAAAFVGPGYLVCRLLLEKKKKNPQMTAASTATGAVGKPRAPRPRSLGCAQPAPQLPQRD